MSIDDLTKEERIAAARKLLTGDGLDAVVFEMLQQRAQLRGHANRLAVSLEQLLARSGAAAHGVEGAAARAVLKEYYEEFPK